MLGQDDVRQWVRLVAQTPVPPVVESVAELIAAGDRLEVAADGVEAEVAAANGNRGNVGAIDAAHVAAVARGRAVDFVIEPELQVVDDRLRVLGPEAGVDLAADVGLAVPVGVLEVPDVGARRDEDAALPRDN